jgi:ATP-dependent Clp endopeptidase proteolytic subunit ClpP
MLILDMFDFIGEDWLGDGITAKWVARQLAINPDETEIVVRLNSPGGDVFEGTTIYNLLRAHEASVRVEIHGYAASMASVIALAGDEVIAAESAMMMVHNPWGITIGDAADHRERAEFLEKIKMTMAKIYASRSGVDAEKAIELMDAETWMDADEMVALGFADRKVSSFSETKEQSEKARVREVAMLKMFARVPPQLLTGQRVAAAAITGKPTMDKEQILALLGLSADATDAGIKAAVENLKSPPSLRDMVPRADLDAANQKIAVMEHAKKEEDEKRFASEVQSTVDRACAEGKIPPASKDYHLRTAGRSPEALADFRDYAANIAPVISTQTVEGRKTPDDALALTDEDRIVMEQTGVSEEQYLAARPKGKSDVYGGKVSRGA